MPNARRTPLADTPDLEARVAALESSVAYHVALLKGVAALLATLPLDGIAKEDAAALTDSIAALED